MNNGHSPKWNSSQYTQLVFPCFPLSTGPEMNNVLSLMEIRDYTTRFARENDFNDMTFGSNAFNLYR